MSSIILQPGDIFLSTTARGGEGNLSEIIKKSSQRKGEEKTRSSHVGLISKGGELLPYNPNGCMISEVIYKKARTIDLVTYQGVGCVIYRPISVDSFNMDCMINDFKKEIEDGLQYGWFNILLHGADSGLNWTLEKIPGFHSDIRPFTRLFFSKNAICSSKVAQLYRDYHSLTLGKPPRLIQPDCIDDHCAANPRSFEVIYEGIIQ